MERHLIEFELRATTTFLAWRPCPAGLPDKPGNCAACVMSGIRIY